MEDCWICQSIDHVIVGSLKILTFHKPLVNGHLVLAPVEHVENWQGLNKESSSALLSKIGEIEKIMKEYLECEKIYIMSIGDMDKHVHFHVVPKMSESVGMGKFIFGEEGWVSNTDQSNEENESKSLGLLTTIMMEMG